MAGFDSQTRPSPLLCAGYLGACPPGLPCFEKNYSQVLQALQGTNCGDVGFLWLLEMLLRSVGFRGAGTLEIRGIRGCAREPIFTPVTPLFLPNYKGVS